MEVYPQMKNPFKREPLKPVVHYIHHHSDDRKVSTRGSKYGKISYNKNFNYEDSAVRREISRSVTRESLTAKALKKRLIDNVVNVGMSWESTPLWDMIKDASTDKEVRRTWTVDIENRLKLYSDSKESDIKGEMTFSQLQRLVFDVGFTDGEAFIALRYLSNPKRMSNVTAQLLNNDQVSTPYDATLTASVKKRGGSIVDGVEFDSVGKEVAVWVQPAFNEKHTRIPYFSPSGRRFVIHYNPGTQIGESRGVPEMAALSYELSRLTEVEINEIEKMASASTWMGVVTQDKDSVYQAPDFLADSDGTSSEESAYTPGIDTVDVGDKAMIMNNLNPGQTFDMFKSDYTNTNLDVLLNTYESRTAGAVGLSLAFLKNKHDSNYTAARATILFDWNNILVRRDDLVSGFLSLFLEAIISEWVKDGTVKAPGFDTSTTARLSWLRGMWNGTNRPSVDPVKDAASSKMRRMLGDTTGEREAKMYNGSDWRENVERLQDENSLLANANEPLQRQDNTTISESLVLDEDPDNNNEEDGN